ncbi:Rieske 2Fe-2S domain-containing protein [Ramlibacter sp.]|uniref:Rieske 2Fe-2S domain-containing protein n=1 Tax=Ramlibacter sp. TaxID=1917967 RepID=UPI003D0C4F4D
MNTKVLQPYGAYFSPRDFSEDAVLTHVGRGTPCGEYLRRYWQPVGFASDLGDLPTRIRILGEDLVLFKDGSGHVGVLELHCAHRGASLEFGVIEPRGIRCFYHGFLYGTDGTILETPAGAPLCGAGKVCQGAYPVHVFHDLVFIYMGPPDRKPAFPMFDVYDDPNIVIEPAPLRTGLMECNWLQVQENGMDPAHTAFLHVLMSGTQRGFSDEMGVLPHMEFFRNETGTHYVATRRVGDNAWVRIVDATLGNVNLIPPDDQKGAVSSVAQNAFTVIWAVPVDDTATKRWYLLLNDKRDPLKDYQKARAFGQANDRSYEERQRRPGDYDAQTSQGPINIHAYETLTTSDLGIQIFRDYVREQIRRVQQGEDPDGVSFDPSYRIRTRTQNTVVSLPRVENADEERERLAAAGREVAEGDFRRQWPPARKA